MPHRSSLPAKGIVIADGYAAGDSYHSHKQVILAYHIVMSQMHQVIQFGPVADNRTANGRPVNTGVAADLHVIAQHYIAGLLHLVMFPVVRHKTEAVTADDTAGLQYIPVADDAAFPHRSVRIYHAVFSHFHMASDIRMGIDNRPIPDFRSGFYHRKSLDGHIRTDFSIV